MPREGSPERRKPLTKSTQQGSGQAGSSQDPSRGSGEGGHWECGSEVGHPLPGGLRRGHLLWLRISQKSE